MTSGKQDHEAADPRGGKGAETTPGRDRDEHDKDPKQPQSDRSHISDYVTQPPGDAQDS